MDDLEAARARFRAELVEAGVLLPLGVPGVWGRSRAFESVIRGFEARVTALGREEAEGCWYLPALMSREQYLKTNHIHNFPDLLGSLHSFAGGDKEHRALTAALADGQDWTAALSPTQLMLVPAGCYPLYPTLAGTIGAEGRCVELETWIFRHEPSPDPARMMAFRQQEFVRVGSPDQALAHRDLWIRRGLHLLESLGLPVRAVVANDPFFGRGGRLAKATQREQELKYELVVPITSEEHPTAVSSCNYHLDYFGHTFGIHLPDGGDAHTACVGYGVERIALALFRHHGMDVEGWPPAVRAILGLG